jgi:four helix bundle protein
MKFGEIEVWKWSARLSAKLYKAFAGSKDFGFKDQIPRFRLSIPSNIAEGTERNSQKEFIRLLQYAKGSCEELRTQIYIGIDIDPAQGKELLNEAREISAMLVGFVNSIEKRLKTED